MKPSVKRAVTAGICEKNYVRVIFFTRVFAKLALSFLLTNDAPSVVLLARHLFLGCKYGRDCRGGVAVALAMERVGPRGTPESPLQKKVPQEKERKKLVYSPTVSVPYEAGCVYFQLSSVFSLNPDHLGEGVYFRNAE